MRTPDPFLLQISAPVDELPQEQLMTLFWIAVGLSVILPRLPYGRTVLYPFALLSTWVHEMGHGLAAIAVGGKFESLQIYRSLGGQAVSSGVSGARRAVVSAGGLLGPAFAGGLVIVLGSRQTTAPFILGGVAATIVFSLVAFVRNGFGLGALGLIAAALAGTALYAPLEFRVFLAQLIGIQFCLACWGTLDYMFTKNFHRDGYVLDSDTQEIANVLALPYWFWGATIALLSFAVLVGAFYLAWMLPNTPA